MLKQSAIRNQRYTGIKVKHVLKIFVLLAICIWLLKQLSQSYDKKKAYQDGTERILEKLTREHGAIKLGRKILDPQVQVSNAQSKGIGGAELDEEVEESKTEEGEDEGRGGGDDEIDGRDQEKSEEEESEEVEDLIDEEDRDKENQIEDSSLLEDQTENRGEENSQETRDDQYKDDDASSAGVQNTPIIGTDVQFQRFRKLKAAEREW